MNTNKVSQITKILAILLLSFFVSSVMNSEIFMGNTPVVRPNLSKYIAQRINSFSSSGKAMLASIFNPVKRETEQRQREAEKAYATAVEKLKDKPMIPVSKGVYAQTDGETTIRTVKLDEIEATEYTFIVDGKPLKIRIPEGVDKGEVEKKLNEMKKVSQ